MFVHVKPVCMMGTLSSVCMCVWLSKKKSIILFEARLTFGTFLIENNEPERLVVAQIPQRAPQVQKSP